MKHNSLSTRLTLVVAGAALVLGACGEERPPAADPPPPTAAPEVDPGAPAAGETSPTPSPTPVPTPVPAPTPAPPTPAATAPPEAATAQRLRPISLPEFPAQVAAVAATPSLASLVEVFGRAGRELGDVPVPADPVAAALEVMRMQLMIEDISWFDTRRPLRLATPDPRAFPNGFVAVIPLSGDADAVRAAFGERLVAVEGHAGRITFGGRQVFVDFLGEHLVVTSHPPLFSALAGFVSDTLLAWTPADLLVVEVSVTHVKRAFANELSMLRDLATGLGGELARRAAVPMQAATLRGLIDGAFDFIDHTDRLGFAFAATGTRLHLALGIRGVADSSLAATIGRLGDIRLQSLAAASAATWLGIATHLPRELLDLDRDKLIADLVRSEAFPPDAAGRVADRMIELAAQSTGDSTSSFEADGPFGFAFSSVSGVRDGDTARIALLGLLDLFFERGVGEARAQLGPGGPAAAPGTFKELVDLANTVGGPLGARLELVDGPQDGVHVSALVLHIDWERVAIARTDPALFGLLKTVLGARLGLATASGEGRLALAVGPNAVTRAASLAAGRFPGGEPNLTQAGDGAFAAVVLRLGPMLSALSALPAFAPHREAFAQLPAGEAFVFDARSEGGDLVMTFTLPLPLLVTLFR